MRTSKMGTRGHAGAGSAGPKAGKLRRRGQQGTFDWCRLVGSQILQIFRALIAGLNAASSAVQDFVHVGRGNSGYPGKYSDSAH